MTAHLPDITFNDVHADAAPGDVGDLLCRGEAGANISIATSSSLMFSLTVKPCEAAFARIRSRFSPRPIVGHFNANVAALMFGRQN